MEQLLINQTKTNEGAIDNSIGRIHRVGSITAGITMIIWGIIFFLSEVNLAFDVKLALKLWPFILVGLGIELLWVNGKQRKIIYDKGAVFLMVIMTLFSMGMAIADRAVTYFYVLRP